MRITVEESLESLLCDPSFKMDSLSIPDSCICDDLRSPSCSGWMIECDVCHVWFHQDCVSLSPESSDGIDKYHCPRCEPMCGPSILKKRWPGVEDTLTRLGKVSCRTLSFSKYQGPLKEEPLLLSESDGLQVPESLSLDKIVGMVGEKQVIEVIRVAQQQTVSMTLGEMASAFKKGKEVLNCISLEVSNTPLGRLIHPPKLVRESCWVHTLWRNQGALIPPKVSKYCIMSMANSFTDFHIDFGGSSVWYHVVSGQKVFYLAEPSEKNIKLYEQWSNQTQLFLGELLTGLVKIVLNKGQTLLIPSGWIHAVFTCQESIVLGGNFLHFNNLRQQLCTYDLERRIKTPGKFTFPNFQTLTWYAAETLVDINNPPGGKDCPVSHADLVILLQSLTSWKDTPPFGVDCDGILKQLQCIIDIKKKRPLKLTITQSLKRKTKQTLNDELSSTLNTFEKNTGYQDISLRRQMKDSTHFITQVHQDDNYIYPSLEVSDDEDFSLPKDKDQSYTPKVKIDNIRLTNRPVRHGVKKIEVEKALKMASRKLKKNRKPVQRKKEKNIIKEKKDPVKVVTKKKSKKGLLTAKQRLSKKLKLLF